jgi:hypothetical protein
VPLDARSRDRLAAAYASCLCRDCLTTAAVVDARRATTTAATEEET